MDTRGAALRAPLVSACLLLTFAFAIAAPAGAEDEKDLVLPGCGICYPGGYDPNTVGEVRGPISDIDVPDDGPVRFAVNGEEERWIVLASPAWFWKSLGFRPAPGDTVAVRGSKSLGADGKLYIIAQSISLQGEQPALLLRDARGVPLWREGHGRGGTRGGGRWRR